MQDSRRLPRPDCCGELDKLTSTWQNSRNAAGYMRFQPSLFLSLISLSLLHPLSFLSSFLSPCLSSPFSPPSPFLSLLFLFLFFSLCVSLFLSLFLCVSVSLFQSLYLSLSLCLSLSLSLSICLSCLSGALASWRQHRLDTVYSLLIPQTPSTVHGTPNPPELIFAQNLFLGLYSF